eukprot:TRINITY_DN312_c2_g1_i2.p1 TRINITY_DN312_c2_g1~~TRINITY_DN312_c2_g1_i2.p1  ORF type:complete len:532 (+),score=228.25 TRINITY_DN312_c2_g1_i2:78-1673(+)
MSIANIEAKLRKNNENENKISRQEVEKHNTKDSSWIIINGRVYDITKFALLHPGGEDILREYAGKDATEMFYDLHREETLDKYKGRLYIGDVKDEVPEDIMSANDARISTVPYAESAKWREGWFSPYYNETHVEYRKKIRKWFAENVREEAVAFNNMDKPPSLELNQKVAMTGLYAARLGPGPWLNGRNIFGVNGEDFDSFHELITHEEWTRIAGALSVQDGLGTGLVIGLPPVLLFGQSPMRERVAKECFDGDKRICLAISEPFAGSDVANIKCTATKTEDGKHYIVSGIKKWITNGVFCDYFVTAVRTGGPGIGGISLLLVERSEGLTTKNIKTSYGSSAGTAYVIYEKVKVPVENLLGMENGGFQCIMANFNHERWFIVCSISAGCRSIVEECFKWAMQRRVFGKKLISQPVIRQKLGTMIYKVETVHAWLEEITYQITQMPQEEQFFKLGGPIALLKTAATRMAYDISDNACQIFGGRAITKSNQGKYIEEFQRSIKYGAILGGAEEVMVDLGVRLAQRNFPPQAKL